MASSSSAQEQNKQVVRQYIEAFNRQDIERMRQLVVSSTNQSFHFPGMPTSMDWERAKQLYASFWSAFPDLSAKIEEIVSEGDKVAIRVINTGTHKGEFQGIAPTNKKVSFGGRDFVTLRDGKIAEQWAGTDMMELMQQIGAIPMTSHAIGTNSTTRS